MRYLLFPLLLTATLHAQDASDSLTREQALKLARTIDGQDSGSLWFEHGDKEGPYHHAGRVILGRRDHVSYQVAGKDGLDSQTGLYVDDDTWETHLDYFTGKSGAGWVVCHNFAPQIAPTAPPRRKDQRSSTQKALGPAAAFAIEQGDLEFLKTLLAKGLEVNAVLDFEKGTTPLYAAVWERSPEITAYLLNKGADRNLRTKYKDRPIDLAIEWKLDEICQLLAVDELEDPLIAGSPHGLLAEIFAGYDTAETTFIEWNGEDPPADLLGWLQKTIPNARPVSRMETLDRRPLGAHSWYRDKTDGDFGRLLQVRLESSGPKPEVRFRDTVGPSMAGGGWEAGFTRKHGYWIRKDSSSWDE